MSRRPRYIEPYQALRRRRRRITAIKHIALGAGISLLALMIFGGSWL